MKLLLITILLGSIKITAYQSKPQNTDSSPFHTSTGARVKQGGCAVSRDLLCGACRKLHKECLRPNYNKKLHYGSTLFIKGHGFVTVNDIMGEYTKQRINRKIVRLPITRQIDIWVPNYKEEHKIFLQYRCGKSDVWEVRQVWN